MSLSSLCMPLPDDVTAAVRDEPRRSPSGRPWVLINMISSADGATAVDGTSAGLGAPADKAVFRALRALADVILVGASTVRAERYGRAKIDPDARAVRERAGQSPAPRIAVVSASGDLDPDLPLFAADEVPHPDSKADPVPLVFTTEAGAEVLGARLGDRCELEVFAGEQVDLAAAVESLGTRGASVVLCEGGPRVNAGLLEAGVIDELCLSVAPVLAGGEAVRVIHGGQEAGGDATRKLHLVRAFEQDGLLALRYLVDRAEAAAPTVTG